MKKVENRIILMMVSAGVVAITGCGPADFEDPVIYDDINGTQAQESTNDSDDETDDMMRPQNSQMRQMANRNQMQRMQPDESDNAQPVAEIPAVALVDDLPPVVIEEPTLVEALPPVNTADEVIVPHGQTIDHIRRIERPMPSNHHRNYRNITNVKHRLYTEVINRPINTATVSATAEVVETTEVMPTTEVTIPAPPAVIPPAPVIPVAPIFPPFAAPYCPYPSVCRYGF